MSEQTFHINIDGFYYNSPNREGLQVTAMSPRFPAALRAELETFMTGIDFNGSQKEERLLYCPVLKGFVKLFISSDATYARDFFYRGITVNDREFYGAFTAKEDAFVNKMNALLRQTDHADSKIIPQQLPVEQKNVPLIAADSLASFCKNDVTQLSRLVYLAFNPILTLGGQISTFRFPADGGSEPQSNASASAALFVLSVLPEPLLEAVTMRFSADSENLTGTFKCKYCFLRGQTNAKFDLEKPMPLQTEEDPMGIYAALGAFIAAHGLSAYRERILPVINCWATACLQEGHFSTELLYLLLSGIADLKITRKQLTSDTLARYFGTRDADWYAVCAPSLLHTLRTLPMADAIRRAMQDNALFSRTAEQLPEDGMDPFFLLYASLHINAPYDEKAALLTSLYERFSTHNNGLAVLYKVKASMNLTLQLPASPTPENIFEGVRSLERGNAKYVSIAAHAAADGYTKTQNTLWINCLHDLLSAPATADAVASVLDVRCEDLLAAAQDRKTLAWICAFCKKKVCEDPAFGKKIISVLSDKRISYDELVLCVRTMGLNENDIPEPPKAKELDVSVHTLSSLAAVTLPKKEPELSAVQAGILDRLCKILEGDCTWPDFCKYIPEILSNAKFKPTMRIQPKLEKLLLRQLTVLATDILNVQGGQTAYVEFLVGLRRDFCLCLYPTKDAAAGKFDEKKFKTSAVKKAILRRLPLIPLFLAVLVSIAVLYIVLPLFPANSVWQQALPGVFCGIGAVLILLQTLIIRKNSAADYILPPAVVMLAAGLLQLLL